MINRGHDFWGSIRWQSPRESTRGGCSPTANSFVSLPRRRVRGTLRPPELAQRGNLWRFAWIYDLANVKPREPSRPTTGTTFLRILATVHHRTCIKKKEKKNVSSTLSPLSLIFAAYNHAGLTKRRRHRVTNFFRCNTINKSEVHTQICFNNRKGNIFRVPSEKKVKNKIKIQSPGI